jgi:hypothetical protein
MSAVANASGKQHPHGTRSKNKITNRTENGSTRGNLGFNNSNNELKNADDNDSSARITSILNQLQQQLRLQQEQKATGASKSNPTPKKPNLTYADRSVLYRLMEIYKPIGNEMWQKVAVEYNKTQAVKRDWRALKRHYTDMVRRALVKPSGETNRSVELERVLEIEDVLNSDFAGALLGNDSFAFDANATIENEIVLSGDENSNDKFNTNEQKTSQSLPNNISDYTESDLVNALVNLTESEFQDSNKTIATPATSSINSSASTTSSQTMSTNSTTNHTTVNAGNVNTIVQLSRTGPVKRLKDIVTNETGGKRTRLDTELVKLVQTMTNNANSSANSGSDNASLQQMILQLHNQTQQILMNFQQQQQLQQERYELLLAKQQQQLANCFHSEK